MDAADVGGLDALSVAGVSEEDLTAVVGSALGRGGLSLLGVRVESINPPGSNITTGGLWRVSGGAGAGRGAGAGEGSIPFSVIAKLINSPLLWPGIGVVPHEFRQLLADRYPWRTEAQAYSSALNTALPGNARLPNIFRLTELDGQRTLIWMEDVDGRGLDGWTDQHFADAAFVLGSLAGSRDVGACVDDVADATDIQRIRFFLESVASQVFIPAIRSDEVWQHPAVAAAADPELISGLRGLADRSWELMEELAALPQLPAHGDASPQNLLIEAPPSAGTPTRFVMIDWGNFGRTPAGFDLAQLLAGRVNAGLMAGADLYRLSPLCLTAYCDGMADAGAEPERDAVSRGHAAAMALFTGLSALPFDQLGSPPPPGPARPELEQLVAGRLDMARFILDLLDVGPR